MPLVFSSPAPSIVSENSGTARIAGTLCVSYHRTSNTGTWTVRIIVVVVLPTISARRGECP